MGWNVRGQFPGELTSNWQLELKVAYDASIEPFLFCCKRTAMENTVGGSPCPHAKSITVYSTVLIPFFFSSV